MIQYVPRGFYLRTLDQLPDQEFYSIHLLPKPRRYRICLCLRLHRLTAEIVGGEGIAYPPPNFMNSPSHSSLQPHVDGLLTLFTLIPVRGVQLGANLLMFLGVVPLRFTPPKFEGEIRNQFIKFAIVVVVVVVVLRHCITLPSGLHTSIHKST